MNSHYSYFSHTHYVAYCSLCSLYMYIFCFFFYLYKCSLYSIFVYYCIVDGIRKVQWHYLKLFITIERRLSRILILLYRPIPCRKLPSSFCFAQAIHILPNTPSPLPQITSFSPSLLASPQLLHPFVYTHTEKFPSILCRSRWIYTLIMTSYIFACPALPFLIPYP